VEGGQGVKARGEEREALREAILAEGFDEVRFADLSPVPEERLRKWIEAGYHADMEWLRNSIEKRLNPDLVLEGACSVIMLGINYLPDREPARSQGRWGKYSLYSDYHDTVLKGVRRVGALLERRYSLAPGDYRGYVDTGPIMERGWAAASGMGWQGKNGMLISRKHGNWLLLATILTRLEIEPDAPLRKGAARNKPELGLLCGKCRRCIDACPTDAIVEPGTLDAERCISYQTIENKGIIPREMRAKIGSRVFGCDICLDVCPWNRFAKAGRQALLSQRYDLAELGLLDLLEMDVERYRETFRKTPMKRAKRRGLLRNACVAAGNLLESEEWREGGEDWMKRVAAALVRVAEEEEPVARVHAVWALYRLLGDEAAERLDAARAAETHPEVLEEYRYWEERAPSRPSA